jgi:ATP-dependent Zn protease
MEELRHRLETFVTFMNMSVIPSNYTFQQQSITFESLMMNYLVDLNLMSKGVYDNTLILPLSYSEAVINLQNATVFNQLIDASIEGSIKTSLTLAICMSILILILLIIMFFFLRSRLSMHEKIFDLFASI